MKRIKNWLRSTMGQNRFSCLALANIEGQAAKSLKADDILDAFIKTGNLVKLRSQSAPRFLILPIVPVTSVPVTYTAAHQHSN
nr:unnamed protein product [Callosobruchus chinensis]